MNEKPTFNGLPLPKLDAQLITHKNCRQVEKAPERMRLTPVRSKVVTPGCLLPENFTGDWINTANIDADVFINSTHVVEEWHPDVSRKF